jgi:hypothetical protein
MVEPVFVVLFKGGPQPGRSHVCCCTTRAALALPQTASVSVPQQCGKQLGSSLFASPLSLLLHVLLLAALDVDMLASAFQLPLQRRHFGLQRKQAAFSFNRLKRLYNQHVACMWQVLSSQVVLGLQRLQG